MTLDKKQRGPVESIKEKELKEVCSCVGKHVPLPHRLYKLTTKVGVIYVCPTTWENIIDLRDEYGRNKGRPPGNVRKHYSEFVQKWAEVIYNGV